MDGKSSSYKGREKNKFLSLVHRKIPITEWLPLYDKLTAVSDLIAGITLGLTLVPQSIAYAALAGLPVQYGLYSSFIGTMLYSIFGTVKEVSIGPTSLMALLTFSACKDLGIEHVVLLTFLSGCVVMLMGLLRLGFLVDLISAPVTNGFTSATAVIIIATQLKGILGLSFHGENIIVILKLIFEHRSKINYADFALGVSCIIFILSLRKLKDLPVSSQAMKRTLWMISIARNAIVVLLTSTISLILVKNDIHALKLSGKVQPGLPKVSLPPFGYNEGNTTVTFVEMCQNLNSSIVIVPIIMVLANIAIAKAFSAGTRIDASQEMLTLGLCNMVGSFFNSMPTTGAFTRSAVSHASGVKTPFAGVYSGIITLLALAFLTPYFGFIPKATLSSVLICAVIFMIDYQTVIKLWRRNKRDCYMLLLTFIISLLQSVEVALFVGILANLACLIYCWARPNITVETIKTSGGGKYLKIVPAVGLFYLNIDNFKQRVTKAAANEGENIYPIVIDCSHLQTVDYSACEGLGEISKKFENTLQEVFFFNASSDVLEKLHALKGIKAKSLVTGTEMDLLEVLFCKKDDVEKSEAMPLLVNSF